MLKKTKIAAGVVHEIPQDLKKALAANADVLEKWNGLTPLARNEWICWVIFVKKQQTRENHIERLQSELLGGKHRPCCWAGCPHRK
jgi:uncharacterized protein YdeI (YjbR/CyaY-like superfamily)